ncbi:MAG TPA: ABC transporter ATP-binding protein [Solirubrobacterales bacterium]|nr:ABC transporter ATP-binding protein [Solirubrobacterales bacterium]
MSGLLRLEHLQVRLPIDGEPRTVVHDVSLDVSPGEAVAIVGESGSGKSTTLRAVARLLPPGSEVRGEVLFSGESVTAMGGRALRQLRTGGIGMVFQDARANMNPVRRVGDFLVEALVTNLGQSREEASRRVASLLQEVGIADPERRLRQYPHELSGGLLQRVMIAAVVAMEPRLILADEPTSALDVTTQAEVLALLDGLRRSRGMALLLVTHDLELAAAVCDRTAVMYAGSLVEEQRSALVHEAPLHPYTAGLIESSPHSAHGARRLPVIPGRPLSGLEVGVGCPFADRCAHVRAACRVATPPLHAVGAGSVACLRAEELLASGLEGVANGC